MVSDTQARDGPTARGRERLAIEIHDLIARYGRKKAVDGLSLSVPEGSFYGFLGPHGAGKTTTIRTLLGFRKPDGGAPTNFLVCLVSVVLSLLAALWLFNRKAY
jgi:ABC-type multidrug transport system fused ATPase/permease subunit